MRVYYAHILEPVDAHHQLRVAFANPDSTPFTPADGITISIRTDANYWTAGAWQLDETGNPTTVNLDNGTAFIKLNDFIMNSDIVLPLYSDAPKATGLLYQPENPSLEPHLHVQWNPEL